MNKKLSILIVAAALSTAFCFCACGGDKTAKTTTAAGASTAASSAAESKATDAAPAESESSEQASENGSGIPQEGDTYKGKKVGSVEKVPDCDDDKHGVIYIYDENDELIEAIKY